MLVKTESVDMTRVVEVKVVLTDCLGLNGRDLNFLLAKMSVLKHPQFLAVPSCHQGTGEEPLPSSHSLLLPEVSSTPLGVIGPMTSTQLWHLPLRNLDPPPPHQEREEGLLGTL